MVKAQFYHEKDEYGSLIELEKNGMDTSMLLQRLQIDGDSFNKSLIISKKRRSNSADSVMITRRQWFDDQQNLILTLTQMDAISEPPLDELKSINYEAATRI